MTTIKTTTEYRVEEPSDLADIEQRIDEQRTALERLENLFDDVDELYIDAAELDSSNREAVAQEMRELQHDFVGISTIDDLKAAYDRIAEVIRAPYRQAVKRARMTVCETVGITPGLTDETREDLNKEVQRREPDDLRDMAASFDRVQDRLTTLPQAARTAVGRTIEADLYRILSAPETNLEPLVEEIGEQAAALETIDEALAETTWRGDTLALVAETPDYYDPAGDAVDADTVVQYVRTIDDRVADTEGLELATVAQVHLARGFPREEPTTLVSVFESLSRDVTQCARHESVFVRTETLFDAVDDPSVHGASTVVGYVTEIQRFVETPDDDEPARRLAAKLGALAEAYEEWAETYASWLTWDAVAISAVEQFLTELPTFSAPPDAVDLMEGAVSEDTVAEHPGEAVAAHTAYELWVEALRGAAGKDTGADIDHLLALVRGETVSATDVGPEEFETLGKLLGDVLTLQLSDASEEAS